MKTQWTGRVVIFDDESTAYEDLKDRRLDYYEIDDDELYTAAYEN